MFQWNNNKIVLGISCLSLATAFGLGIYFSTPLHKNRENATRLPDAVAASGLSEQQLAQSEWSVSIQDFENSNPRGRSYFDYVFSKTEQGKRVYEVPYPFSKLLDRLSIYLGYSPNDENNSPLLKMLFPMGRSLQRNASLTGQTNYDENLFYRFPRVVVGVGLENKAPLALNLKGRMYLGFHEKSQVIEAISYNDEEGRFEYQVVRDYVSGKTPKVFYANRQLCLSCHQNQTPIFSVGPWNESNAHSNVYTNIESNLKRDLGESRCDGDSAAFCYKEQAGAKQYYYFGSPTRIDLNIPYSFDNLTDLGNYFHALQKSWLNLCADKDCQRWVLRSVIKYVLSGQEGIYDENGHSQRLQKFEKDFQQKFPYGIKIPSPNVPNRDPQADKNLTQAQIEVEAQISAKSKNTKQSLQDLLKQNAVAGEVEPLMPRGPIELWNNTEMDQKLSNRMIRGFAEFFSHQDTLLLDRWLAGKSQGAESEEFRTICKVTTQKSADAESFSLVCPPSKDGQVLLENMRLSIKNNAIESGSLDNLIFIAPKADGQKCDYRVAQTVQNRVTGQACPTVLKALLEGAKQGDTVRVIPYRRDRVHSRLLEGSLVKELVVNVQTGELRATVVKDIKRLMDLVDKMEFIDPITKRAALLPFSRKMVMAAVAKSLNIPQLNLDEEQKIESLEKNLDEDEKSEGQIQAEVHNPIDGAMQSCGMCHYNFEGVPPAFLGLKQSGIDDVQKCERLRVCAARIMYRIKMKNCSPEKVAQFKKNPMPLPVFFQRTKVDQNWWQKNISPQLVAYFREMIQQNDLVTHLKSQGIEDSVAVKSASELLNSNCPDVDYNIYESLPRCQFPDAQSVSSTCEALVEKWKK
jgi:hypothetical protein